MSKEQEKLTAVEVRRAYYREWRKNNPDKVKRYNANFWENRAQKIAAKTVDKNDKRD